MSGFDSRTDALWSQTDHHNQQRKLYEEIVDTLITAGYFRAQIQTLSEFDKVVGGLCWAIVNSGEKVDVDILFKENSTTGERIALSEAIVKAMRGMGCPSPLQPHQIQGGIGGHDFGALKPVITWLIKKFYERREEREQQLRSFSTLQFRKNYKFPHETEVNEVSMDLAEIMGRNKVKRVYKRASHTEESEETKVHSCLMEYGETTMAPGQEGEGEGKDKKGKGGNKNAVSLQQGSGFSNLTKLGGKGTELGRFEKQLMQEALKAEKEEAKHQEALGDEEKILMASMSSLGGEGPSMGLANIKSLVGLGSEDIGQASEEYLRGLEENQKALELSISRGKFGKEAAYKRQKQNLTAKEEDLGKEAARIKGEADAAQRRLDALLSKQGAVDEAKADLLKKKEELEQQEKQSTQKVELGKLKQLVMLNETLRGQEASFKASCKAHRQSMQEQIDSYDKGDDPDSDENKKMVNIEDMHEKVMNKYNNLRSFLAETNLEVSNSARIIDDIPTRSELIQYERRFVELYQQVAWKLEETRKYYAMYNTLDTSLAFLQKNVKILDSITETFGEAMQTLVGKEEFGKSMDNIVRGLNTSLGGQEETLAIKDSQLDQMKLTHQKLIDEQRAYYTAIKDFQNECDKNEWLMEAIENKKMGA